MQHVVTAIGQPLLDYTISVPDSFFKKEGLVPGSWNLVENELMLSFCKKYVSPNSTVFPGGSAANTASILSSLGVPCSFQGVLGDDEHGKRYRDTYAQDGLDTHFCLSGSLQGICLAFISPSGERTLVTHLGAANEFSSDHLSLDMVKQSTMLYIEGFSFSSPPSKDAVYEAADCAKNSGSLVFLDLSAQELVASQKDSVKQFVNDYVDILIATKSEALALVQSVEEFGNLFAGDSSRYSILKRGSKSTMLFHAGEGIKVPTYTVKTRNTNGAGDAFSAGMLYGVAHELFPTRCVQIGNYLAARVVESLTTRPAISFDKVTSTIANLFL
jgi:sugar/nucleoside kinase (ribokinase family)